jgi:hypothetical protein
MYNFVTSANFGNKTIKGEKIIIIINQIEDVTIAITKGFGNKKQIFYIVDLHNNQMTNVSHMLLLLVFMLELGLAPFWLLNLVHSSTKHDAQNKSHPVM